MPHVCVRAAAGRAGLGLRPCLTLGCLQHQGLAVGADSCFVEGFDAGAVSAVEVKPVHRAHGFLAHVHLLQSKHRRGWVSRAGSAWSIQPQGWEQPNCPPLHTLLHGAGLWACILLKPSTVTVLSSLTIMHHFYREKICNSHWTNL